MSLLQGNKLKLRAVEPEDLDLLLQWENDTENWMISGTFNPFSKSLMKSYIENSHLTIFQTGQYRFIIELKESKEPIGTLDIFDFDPFHKRAGLGVLIGPKDQRGHGYAKESIQLIIEYCFNHLELHQLYCNILVENKSSIKLFEGQGFIQCGIKKEWIRVNSEFKDELLFQLIK